MKNQEIARFFYDMADILDIKGVEWKPVAFRKGARALETLPQSVEEIYSKAGFKGLLEIPGIGEGLGKKIEEYLKTGKMKEYDELLSSIPPGLKELLFVPGLGPKKAAKLFKTLKIDSLEKLESAAQAGKIQTVEGFGEKSEEDILLGLELVKKGTERKLLGNALPIAEELAEKLKKMEGIQAVEIGGSIRRRRETVKDIDLLAIAKNQKIHSKIAGAFCQLEDVEKVIAKGNTKVSVRLKQGLNVDLRILDEGEFGSALLYFTGSKDYNVWMRDLAIQKKWKLSEYGLFDAKGKIIAGKTEEDIFEKLNLPFVPAELREVPRAFSVEEKTRLKSLILEKDIRGDLHMHTNWTDGLNSTEEMIEACLARGYEYIAITDHSKSTYVANGLDEKRLKQHLKEMDQLQKKFPQIHILKGSEVDILKDGSLDYSNQILKELDVVVASIHSRFKSSKKEMTARILTALENEHTTILGHPSGRLINQRNEYEFDFPAVLDQAKKQGVALEVDAYPSRLDLKDVYIGEAVQKGIKISIDSDAHNVLHLPFMRLGVAQARRGFAVKSDVINCLPWKEFQKWIAK